MRLKYQLIIFIWICLVGVVIAQFEACNGDDDDGGQTYTATATATPTVEWTATPTPTIARYTYEIVNIYPHDPSAFTQGLVYHNGYLYEGTGLYGHSSIRKVDLETGQVLQIRDIPSEYFGEGITIWDNVLVQLTYLDHTGFVYDLESFELLGQFSYLYQGWGLTHDSSRLILSEGSAYLYFLDPDTYQEVGSVKVTDGAQYITRINELEYIGGKLYANIWLTNTVVIINPDTGMLTGIIDLTGLMDAVDYSGEIDVLNGIAYDSEGQRLFVTGKLWPNLFEIRLLVL